MIGFPVLPVIAKGVKVLWLEPKVMLPLLLMKMLVKDVPKKFMPPGPKIGVMSTSTESSSLRAKA